MQRIVKNAYYKNESIPDADAATFKLSSNGISVEDKHGGYLKDKREVKE